MHANHTTPTTPHCPLLLLHSGPRRARPRAQVLLPGYRCIPCLFLCGQVRSQPVLELGQRVTCALAFTLSHCLTTTAAQASSM